MYSGIKKRKYKVRIDSKWDVLERRLNFAMCSAGISFRELCEKCGVSRSSYYSHRKNNTLPETEAVLSFAKVLNVSIDWLLGLSVDMRGKCEF